MSDIQGNLTHNMATVTHTINGKFEQNLLSCRIIPVLAPLINPGFYQEIVSIILSPQTLLMPATKEVITDTASGVVWINKTPRQVSRTVAKRSTPGNIHNAVNVVEPSFTVIIVIVGS